jgi:hypothetical protein
MSVAYMGRTYSGYPGLTIGRRAYFARLLQLHRYVGLVRVVLLGMLGRLPFGGQAWIYMNWLRGIQKLGHEVWYVEDEMSWPYDPLQDTHTEDCTYALKTIRECMEHIGLAERWAYRLADRKGASWGLSDDELDALYASCDVLINLQGSTVLREEHMAAPFKVYLETDPAGGELKVATGDEELRATYALHDTIVTYGENYGAPDCRVPLNGFSYLKTRQPIDLELWPAAHDPGAKLFTTIGNYRQHGGDITYLGELYHWSKHHEWERFLDLPSLTNQALELALNGHEPDDKEHLEQHGWRVVNPALFSLDMFGAYPEYIRSSRGEFTVAKDQNVRLRSGWFSDRDACYLASGKPVVCQDTGFGNVIPTGEGLFPVHTPEEAAAAIEEINGDYERHCRGARAVAEEWFDNAKVVRKLFADLGLA